MEFSSILKYGGYGLGGLFAVLVVVWIVVAARILRGTKGLTQALNLFLRRSSMASSTQPTP